MEAILSQENIDGIYYNVKVPKDNPTTIGSFIVPIQGPNYTINGKPFRIHGKIDSYTFRANMDWLVSYALSKMNPTKNGHLQSRDSYKYRDRDSNLVQTISPQQRAINNTLKYLQQKTGRDFSEYYQDGDIVSGNQKVVKELNREFNDFIAFTVDNQIKISNKSEHLKGQITIYPKGFQNELLDSIPSDNLNDHQVDNNGKYYFTIQVSQNIDSSFQNQLYDAEYNSKNEELIITPRIEKTENTNVVLSINQDNFNDYVTEGREILEGIFPYYPTLEDAFSQPTFEEFIQALNNLEYVDEDVRIDDLNEVLEKNNPTPEQRQIINELIELEKSHDPDRQDNQVCPPSFKILF